MMRRRFFQGVFWVVLAILVGSLQIGFINTIPWLRIGVQLCFVVSIVLLLFYSHGAGILAGLLSGYWLDLHSSLAFGIFLFAMTSAVFFGVVLRTRVLKQDAAYAIGITVFLCTWVYWIVCLFLVWLDGMVRGYGIPTGWYVGHLSTAVWQSIIHTVIIIVLFETRRLLGHRFISLEPLKR